MFYTTALNNDSKFNSLHTEHTPKEKKSVHNTQLSIFVVVCVVPTQHTQLSQPYSSFTNFALDGGTLRILITRYYLFSDYYLVVKFRTICFFYRHD